MRRNAWHLGSFVKHDAGYLLIVRRREDVVDGAA